MENFSNNAVWQLKLSLLILTLAMMLMGGCYSFTGASVPEHLKTLSITAVNDNSGFGDPRVRSDLTQLLVDNFRNDNTFSIVERAGDAKLDVVITSINDQTTSVRPGELETERQITVSCSAEYYDAVNRKQIWKKNFSNFEKYELTNAQANRDLAIKSALENISDDILLAVVSGW